MSGVPDPFQPLREVLTSTRNAAPATQEDQVLQAHIIIKKQTTKKNLLVLEPNKIFSCTRQIAVYLLQIEEGLNSPG